MRDRARSRIGPQAPTTTVADHPAFIRQLVERVVVTLDGATEPIALPLSWAGGHISAVTLDRPVVRLEQLSYYPALVHRSCTLHAPGLDCLPGHRGRTGRTVFSYHTD